MMNHETSLSKRTSTLQYIADMIYLCMVVYLNVSLHQTPGWIVCGPELNRMCRRRHDITRWTWTLHVYISWRCCLIWDNKLLSDFCGTVVTTCECEGNIISSFRWKFRWNVTWPLKNIRHLSDLRHIWKWPGADLITLDLCCSDCR